MKNLVYLIWLVMAVQGTAFGQELKVLITADKIGFRPEVNSKVMAEYRSLKAVVPEGSGDYTYTWGASVPHSIISQKSMDRVNAAFNEEDITYRVFVQDNKSGKTGYAHINFKKVKANNQNLRFVAYPNPSFNELTVNLEEAKSTKNLIKVDLFSENSSLPILSIPKEYLTDKTYTFNVKSLPQGVYYVHVLYEGESVPQRTRVLIKR